MRSGVGASPADVGRLTQRQMRVLYNAAVRVERRERARSIIDINAGCNGGRRATDLINALMDSDGNTGN